MAVVAAAASTVSPRTVFHHLTKKKKKKRKNPRVQNWWNSFKSIGLKRKNRRLRVYTLLLLYLIHCRVSYQITRVVAMLQCRLLLLLQVTRHFLFFHVQRIIRILFSPPLKWGDFFSVAPSLTRLPPVGDIHWKCFFFGTQHTVAGYFFCIFIGRSTRVFLYHTHTRCWKQMIVFYSSWTLLWVYKQTHTHVWSREREESRRQKMRLIPSSFTVLLLEDGGTWNLDYEE